MRDQQRGVDALQARNERFVDTGKQTVINMFTYTQDTIDESVSRFIDGTSGPLRDMMSQGNNADNLKALFRDTQASSEAVVNGAALEKVDDIAGNASVLVAVAGDGCRHGRCELTDQALPVAGDRARGRQRAHDRIRPQVPRRWKLMRSKLTGLLIGVLAVVFVAAAGIGGSLYWNRVTQRGQEATPDRVARRGGRSRSRRCSATTIRPSNAA